MAKPKIDFKTLLLTKGEYIAVGLAGLGLVLLLVWGVSRGVSAADPAATAKKLDADAKSVHTKIAAVNPDEKPDPVPEWASKGYAAIPGADFVLPHLPFDPIAKPSAKRENPKVLRIKDYQVDLIRAPMKGYDIVYDTDAEGKEISAKIAVRATVTKGKEDPNRLNELAKALQNKGRGALDRFKTQRGQGQQAKLPAPPPPGAPPGAPPAGLPGAPGGGGMEGMRGQGGQRPGMPGMPFGPGMGGKGMGGGPMGGMPYGGGFDRTGQREDKVIQYIPLEELDKAMAEGKLPAMTVVPLRMVVVNATFPRKEQVEEIRKALRLPNDPKGLATASQVLDAYGFNGFNVRRRVILPNGIVEGTDKQFDDLVKDPEANLSTKYEVGGWAPYDYEGRYNELIESRKLGDRFEGAGAGGTDPDGLNPYLPYFYRYEDSLVMPLPELVTELASYPPIRLNPIKETVAKLKAANVQQQTPSQLQQRLGGQNLKPGENGGRRGQFVPKTGDQTGAGDLFGGAGLAGPRSKPGAKGPTPPKKGGDGKLDGAQPVSIDHLLVRFIDCDVRPGYSYQYQIQIELVNPNWGRPNDMANPAQATEPKYQFLKGEWSVLDQVTKVPEESFLYAYDPAQYRDEVKEKYKEQPKLRERLQAKDNQAAVQAMAWLEQVKTDTSGQREPVGAWVVAEMPVGRGEYVGRRTFVHLPLWSSEQNQYVFRELSAERVVRDRVQPKGWLVDFSTRAVLVDFDGGRVKTRKADGKLIDEDVTTDLLIAGPDGRLQVRSTAVDGPDKNRQEIAGIWGRWIRQVEENRPAAAVGTNNPFLRPGQPPPGSGGSSPPDGGN